MAGAIVRSKGEPQKLLPDGKKHVLPAPCAEAIRQPRERGSAPASLVFIATLLGERLTIDQALERLMAFKSGHDARTVGTKEAAAALVIAELLGWVMWGDCARVSARMATPEAV